MDIAVVKNHWSTVDCSADERNFYAFPPIRERSCRMVFGVSDTGLDWCERLTAEHLKSRLPFERCLSICCGFGHLERSLARLGVARSFVGVDIATGAIEEARRRCAGLPIEYHVADLNADQIQGEYGLVWANGGLHHLENVEAVVAKLHRALRPGGYLICTEYIGPKHQQLGARQRKLIAAARKLLPEELKCHDVYTPLGRSLLARVARRGIKTFDAMFRPSAWRMPPLEFMLSIDPSEGVSSDRVVSALSRYFDIEVRGFGGSIVQYALDGAFYGNFDFRNREHLDALQALFLFEDALLPDLGHDNAHIICTKH